MWVGACVPPRACMRSFCNFSDSFSVCVCVFAEEDGPTNQAITASVGKKVIFGGYNLVMNLFRSAIRLIRDGGKGVLRWGKRESIYLSLHCHHQNDLH